jgi:hypothetical protein
MKKTWSLKSRDTVPLRILITVKPEPAVSKASWRDITGFLTSLSRFLGDLSLSASYLCRHKPTTISESKFWEGFQNAMRHKIQLLKRFTDLSLEINHLDSHISYDKSWASSFKSEITFFWIWTQDPYTVYAIFKCFRWNANGAGATPTPALLYWHEKEEISGCKFHLFKI